MGRLLKRRDGLHRNGRLEDSLKVLFCVGVLVYPQFVGNTYNLDLVSGALMLGVFALSVDLLWGYTGLLNLGPAYAFGLGAYVWAILPQHFHFFDPTWPALLLAMALPAAVGLAISYVSLRVGARGIYFALISLAVTLTLAQATQAWYGFTGGSNGIININFPDIGIPGVVEYELSDPHRFYYFAFAVAALVLAFATFLVKSPFGQVLQAIRDRPVRAETLGFSTLRYQVIVSVVSAALGGLAGAVYAPVTGIVFPDLFGAVMSIQVFVWIAIGGQATLIGPLLGAVAISLGEAYLSASLVSYYLIAVGAAFVCVVLLFPGGIVGAVRRAWDLLQWRGPDERLAVPAAIRGEES